MSWSFHTIGIDPNLRWKKVEVKERDNRERVSKALQTETNISSGYVVSVREVKVGMRGDRVRGEERVSGGLVVKQRCR